MENESQDKKTFTVRRSDKLAAGSLALVLPVASYVWKLRSDILADIERATNRNNQAIVELKRYIDQRLSYISTEFKDEFSEVRKDVRELRTNELNKRNK